METLEQLKEIIKNAPDGATHYDSKNYFTFVSEFNDGLYYSHWRKWVNNKQSMVVYQSRGINNIRSLSDIKRIIELMECQKKSYESYAALEKVKQRYNGENKVAKALLKLAYECDEFALPGDLRKDIKNFIGDL